LVAEINWQNKKEKRLESPFAKRQSAFGPAPRRAVNARALPAFLFLSSLSKIFQIFSELLLLFCLETFKICFIVISIN
jgi:hypothetical protein